MLFAVEEGASFYNTGILWQGFLATSIGVLTVHTLYQLREETEAHIFQTHFGVFREFGLYNDNQALYPIHFWWYVWEIPIFIVMGCWQGLTGAGFVRAYAHIVTPLRQRYIPVTKPLLRLVEVLFLAFVTGLIVFLLTYYSACKDLPTSLSSANKCITGSVLHQDLGAFLEQGEIRDVTEITDMYYKQWFCPANQYSVMGQLFLGPLSRSLKLLLHLGELQPEGFVLFDLFTLGTFYVVVYVLMVWTYGAGCAMGLFVPTLAMGAAYGHLVVRALISILDALNMSHVHPSPHTYAVIGAAGSLGGATRMTISITVLVMETTGSLQLIVPIMFTIFFSKWIGDQFSEGIYDAANMIRGVPFLIEHKASSMRGRTFVAAEKLKVNEVMSGGSAHPMVTLQPILMVKDLTEVLARCNHGGFPVTLDSPTHSCPEFRLQGLITRDRILKMLEHRIGFVTHGENHCPLPTSHCECVELLKKLGTTPFKPLPLEDLRSKLADCTSLMVDLRPFMQKHPFIIHNNMYLSRAYKLFRTMGLRHLFVTAEHHPKVVGCLTRKDVIEEHAKLALANKIDPEVVDLLPHLGGFLNGKGHRKQRRNGVGETSLAGSTNPVNYDDVTLELQSLRQSGDYANVETMSLSSISELERSNRMVSEDRDPFESSSKESSENETEWVPALRLPQLNRKSKVEIIDSKNKR
jgi:chloride channel 7